MDGVQSSNFCYSLSTLIFDMITIIKGINRKTKIIYFFLNNILFCILNQYGIFELNHIAGVLKKLDYYSITVFITQTSKNTHTNTNANKHKHKNIQVNNNTHKHTNTGTICIFLYIL